MKDLRFVRWLIMLLIFVGVIGMVRFLLGGDELSAIWIGGGMFAISSHFLPSWSWAGRSSKQRTKKFPLPWKGPPDLWFAVVMIMLGIVWHVSQNVFAFAIIVDDENSL